MSVLSNRCEATRAPRSRKNLIIVTHGLSGSGKTTFTQSLLEALGAIRIRSDLERKRLFGMASGTPAGSDGLLERYSPTATERTYQTLANLARTILEADFPVIVDATNLKQWQRQLFRHVADERNVPFVILDFQAPDDLLRQRVQQRRAAGNDASEATIAVLEQQIRSCEPLTPSERAACIPVPSERLPPCTTLIEQMLSREK